MAEPTSSQTLLAAVQHHQAGRLAEARALYLHVLDQNPQNADALHLLGVVAHQMGENEEAVRLIGRAVGISPDNPSYLSNLGLALRAVGELDRAIDCYQRALAVGPQADLYNNLGNVLKDKGLVDRAIDAYLTALTLDGELAEAHNNLGNVYREGGRLGDAEMHYRRAIAARPAWCEPYNNLGMVLQARNQLDAAVDCYERAIVLKNDYAEAHNNLGLVMEGVGMLDQAMVCYGDALRLLPGSAEVATNIGNVLKSRGRIGAAIEEYRKAIGLRADYAHAHNNLGNALKDIGRMEEAIACFRRAVAIRPGDAVMHSNLLYALHYPGTYSAEEIYLEHVEWGRRHAEGFTREARPCLNERLVGRAIRVGYVSGNFREQAINDCFEPVLHVHDRNRFVVHCYSDVKSPDAVTRRLRRLAGVWRDCAGVSDGDLAEQIRADGIDILVDLSGHLAENRLLVFARRPAPIGVTWLGYQNTTGMSAMDYLISDAYTTPVGQNERLYTEKIVRLPNAFWCYQPLVDAPEVGALPAMGAGRVTFGFLNHFAKFTAAMMRVWCEILRAVPLSQLLVLTREVDSCRGYLERLMVENGIDPARLVVEGPRDRGEYLRLYGRVNVALDPFPFNGHTTTHDSLWMGVPVVHLSGSTYAARYGGSVLNAVGLGQLIARDEADYVRIAVGLARDLELLAKLREGLRARMVRSPLLDAIGFTRNLEGAYRGMWERWCLGKAAGEKE